MDDLLIDGGVVPAAGADVRGQQRRGGFELAVALQPIQVYGQVPFSCSARSAREVINGSYQAWVHSGQLYTASGSTWAG